VRALVLLAHIAERIQRAALVELVERDQVREIEHVDFFQLGGGAVFRRHHVQAYVGMIDNLRVRLADAGRLQNDEIEIGCLENIERVVDVGG
jgi:hypothetical protein